MITTKGYLAGRIITHGYGPKVTDPLINHAQDTETLVNKVLTFDNDTKKKTWISLIERTVEEK